MKSTIASAVYIISVLGGAGFMFVAQLFAQIDNDTKDLGLLALICVVVARDGLPLFLKLIGKMPSEPESESHKELVELRKKVHTLEVEIAVLKEKQNHST